MCMPVISLKKIYEHDIDLLILEEFVADKQFAKLFLDKAGLDLNYTLISASHSLSDADGESDVTFILQYPNKKVALLIEDKIDAVTMPDQSARYHQRAQKAEAKGTYDTHITMLVAPAAYIEEHKNDPNAAYSHKIKYEELRDHFSAHDNPRATFKAEVIDFAVREKKAGYQVQENKAVTDFWRQLRQFCKENYPNLHMIGEESPKGPSAVWPEFYTPLRTVKVIYKSQKGCVDLEFPKYGTRTGDLRTIVTAKRNNPPLIIQTGQSAVVRLSDERWKLSFTQNFDTCRPILSDVLQAVSHLCELASELNYGDLY